MLNWAGFWRQLGGNFHTDLAGNPAIARYENMLTCVAINGKNKHLRGCGKTFHV